ncbi:two-component regulator propeller domain-containing protein [Echinicola sp. 20G]|uniref:hybrid sensor histidine kinase/response regulator transcription factor n=1 Tax=Echinicola sp. 20G TaxID=2781961 RepID=UPI00190FD6A4|nr:two-component regulator propeller domain-containing protein [Echinicola sp. 20G]
MEEVEKLAMNKNNQESFKLMKKFILNGLGKNFTINPIPLTKYIQYILIFCFLTFAWIFPVFAQDQINNFRHISTSDGFSLNAVNSIDQDQKGMIWFGTRNGLMRYDGKELKVMRREKGSPEQFRVNDIYSIHVDSSKGIWMGTKSGLSLFNPKNNLSKDFEEETLSKLAVSSRFVHDILRVNDHEVWIATKNGINIYDENKKEIRYYLHDEARPTTINSSFVTCLFKSSNGDIWIGTRSGLNKLEGRIGDKVNFKSFKLSRDENKIQFQNYVSCIKEDHMGNLWVGTHNGLFYFNTEKEEIEQFGNKKGQELTNDIIQDITIDYHQRLWVGTYDGLNVIDNNHKLIRKMKHDPKKNNGLTGNDIRALFTDNQGGIWIATYYGGVNYWDDNQLNFELIEERNGTQLGYNVVSCLEEVNGQEVYIGTEGAGLSVLDLSTEKFRNINKLGKGNFIGSVKDIVFDDTYKLWIGTFNRGLIYLDTESLKFKEFRGGNSDRTNSLSTDQLLSLAKSSDGKLWIGTLNQGLDLFDVESNEFRNFNAGSNKPNITSNNVRSLLLSQEGDLFVGTGEGLCVLRKSNYENNTFEFDFFEMENGGEDRLYIHDIFQDSRGNVWLAVQNYGLFRINSDKIIPVSLNGISSIFAISEDHDGKLWLSSEEGILSYDPNSGNQRIYNRNDGVQANEFNRGAKLYSSDGRMFFGGASGIVSFYPKNLATENKYAPNVVLTGFSLSDYQLEVNDSTEILKKSIEYTDEVTLDYDQNIFTINFSMPNFSNADKNTFLYRLKGLDDNWVRTTNNFVSFTIQRGGDYVFEVKGINSDGVETQNPTILEIEVKSAPWLTIWAYIVYITLFLLALTVFIYFFKSRLRLQHKLELETQEFINQQDLNQQKLQFFTNISHEFRTPLTLISGPLEKLIIEYKGPSSVFRQLQVIKRNTDQLFKLINELMDFRKLESKQMKLQAAEGDIVKFANEIYLSFSQQAKLNKLRYSFKSQHEEINVFFDRDKLEKVLYNLISNAFKYTPSKGKIEVAVSESAEKVIIAVKDNGIGISAEHLEKIFDRFYEIPKQKNPSKFRYGSGIGLAIAKNVMDLHKGELKVESEEGKGSKFVMELRLGKEHLEDDEIIVSFKNSEDISLYRKSVDLDQVDENANIFLGQYESLEKEANILIVDDNQDICQFIYNSLKERYKVSIAENGALGYQKALSEQPDLIISDVMMPVMDGIEFCEKVKSDIRTSHIPFILLTARTSLVYKYNGLESGADEYLSKPFELKELLLKCKNIINTQKKLKEKIVESGEFQPSEAAVNSRDEEMMNGAIQIIKNNLKNEFFDIQTLCEELGVSRSLLFTKFKAWTNQTPNDFILGIKMKKAASIIEKGNINVSEVGYQIGFKNPNYFSKAFKKYHGLSPKAYAQKFKESLGI